MSDPTPKKTPSSALLWAAALLAGCVILLLSLRRPNEAASGLLTNKPASRPAASSPSLPVIVRHSPALAPSVPSSPEAILARKLAQFAQKQRAIFEKLAAKHKLPVPDDAKRFFDAIEAGRWDEANALFKALHAPNNAGGPLSDDIRPFWRSIQDTWGAAMMAQRMPAQEYLDYGNAILGALKPGMVYVGGTDPGLFIPNMLNATSDGDQHVVLTQNALADSTYLNYLSELYPGQINMLTADESQQAFQKYYADAAQRLQHDQQFPDEPKQILPGENVTSENGKLTLSGQVAVMGINQILFQTLVQNNPELSFAIEQSSPFKSTYPGALPLGPIMQVGDPTSGLGLSADTAQQAVNYWQTTTQQLLANPEAAGSSDTLLTYSHDAVSQAEMLAANQQPAAAEQTYNLASQLAPTNFEAIAGLSTVLYQNGQANQAIQILNDFSQKNPSQQAVVNTQRNSLISTK